MFWFASRLIWRNYPLTLREAVLVAFLISVILVVQTGIAVYRFLPGRLGPRVADGGERLINPAMDLANRPDIYLSILDGYGRSDILRDYYGYENGEFERFLQSRGFVIPARSRSNYAKTAMSIPSILNMEYTHVLLREFEAYPAWWLAKPVLAHNRARMYLREAGYAFVTIATDWGITNIADADRYFAPTPVMLNDFEGFLIDGTPLQVVKPLLAKVATVPSFESHRRLIEYDFRTLSNLPALPGPKFVFAHVLVPHPPFVFDAQGGAIHPDYPFSFNDANDFPYDLEGYRRQYVEQVQFVNRRMMEVD